jgi:hypothetical protein
MLPALGFCGFRKREVTYNQKQNSSKVVVTATKNAEFSDEAWNEMSGARQMHRNLAVLTLVGLSSLNIAAQAQQSPATGGADMDSIPQQQKVDPVADAQTARSFDGRIIHSGSQFVLRDSNAHTAYKLDDQKKAKQYAGKRVKVTATMDSTSNTLHVIDIRKSARPAGK